MDDSLKRIDKNIYYQSLCTQYSFVGAFRQNEILFRKELYRPNEDDEELKSTDSYDTLNIYSYLNVLPDSVRLCILQ